MLKRDVVLIGGTENVQAYSFYEKCHATDWKIESRKAHSP